MLSRMRDAALAAVALLPALVGSTALEAQTPDPNSGSAADTAQTATTQEPEETFLDAVTVTATGSERTVGDTPGHVDVVTAREVQRLGYTQPADLVTFVPGVYVEGDLTRLGSSGFNIRGIGGNRVLTRIDGVPTAEQFDFGPLGAPQFQVDLETLDRAEIVRSAGSALYGSDALGGVVSLVTRSPRGYLQGEPQHIGLRIGFDGRADELSESAVYARGGDRWSGALSYTHRDGGELDNQGTDGTEDFTRTRPNPIDRRQDQILLKIGRDFSASSRAQATVEIFDAESETAVLSGRAPASPFASAVLDLDAVDTQERRRVSLSHDRVLETLLTDSFEGRVYRQDAATEQVTDELRGTSLGEARRDGLFAFDQQTLGAEATVRKALDDRGRQGLTYGVLARRDTFDVLRDRTETVVATGEPVPTSLVFPTKYFPESEVGETAAFVQGELTLAQDRLRLVPGVRYDRYDLDPDTGDRVFLDGNPGQPVPVGVTEDAVSPKLGAVYELTAETSVFGQYARGFRAPPMSAVNNGFTNLGGGYRTLPNPELDSETSDNLELGLRGRFTRGGFSLTGFENRYDDFIDTVTLGFDPIAGLIEFQPQNITEVEIRGLEAAADVRFTDAWSLRSALSWTEGDNVETDQPLESISPPRWVTGLRYAAAAGWGAEGIVTAVASKDADDLPADSTQFQAPSYELFDLAAWWPVTERLTLQASARNLTDETYWQWGYVRGQTEGSAVLDRYTSPGRSYGIQARMSF